MDINDTPSTASTRRSLRATRGNRVHRAGFRPRATRCRDSIFGLFGTAARFGSGFLEGDGPDHKPAHTVFNLQAGKSFGTQWTIMFTALNVADLILRGDPACPPYSAVPYIAQQQAKTGGKSRPSQLLPGRAGTNCGQTEMPRLAEALWSGGNPFEKIGCHPHLRISPEFRMGDQPHIVVRDGFRD